MPIEIKIRKNEPIDRALRRMKKKLERENIIKGTRAKRYYEKPCEKRRRKEKVQAFTQMLRRRYAEYGFLPPVFGPCGRFGAARPFAFRPPRRNRRPTGRVSSSAP